MSIAIRVGAGLLAASLGGLAQGGHATCGNARVEELPVSGFPAQAKVVRPFRDRLIVLDSTNHRILVLRRDMTTIRQIALVGQDDSGLWKPEDIAVGPSGKIYVLNDGGHEIKVFSQTGELTGRLKLTSQAAGIVLNSKEQILVGQPHSGRLISQYDTHGHLIRTFGTLRNLSTFYDGAYAEKDKLYYYVGNRVNLALDQHDNVIASFASAPYVERFDPSGNLLGARLLDTPDTRQVISEYKQSGTSTMHQGFADDHASAPFIATSAGVSPAGTQIYISFIWKGGWIETLDQNLNPVGCITSPGRAFWNLTAESDGRTLLAARLTTHPLEMHSIFRISVLPVNAAR